MRALNQARHRARRVADAGWANLQAASSGVSVPISRGGGLNTRVAPLAALRAPLQIDLDILGPWLSTTQDEVTFIQIGAFDGLANDPLHDLVRRFRWRGILVEPQPEPFQRLRQTYAGQDGLEFINAAVADQAGSVTLWRVVDPRPDDPWWVGQSASFDRDHLVAHVAERPDLIERIQGVSVPAVTLPELFARASRPVDVLQVDAEGYDAHIVAMLDGVSHSPTIVRFEHRHLSAAEHADAVGRLAARGYRFAINADDTLAVRYRPGRGSTAVS